MKRIAVVTAGMLAAWLLASGAGSAQVPGTAAPEGVLSPGGELVDREFGVGTHRFGLDRRVEMYQWLRTGHDRYEQAWKAALVDSSDFAPGHENPPSIPLESRRVWAQEATLDGRPIDVTVVKVLGRWQDFRPNFSRLPGNLSATFQPDGDGLTSSENPLDPQVGDLRVTWRELALPPLAGRVKLVDGVWQLAPRATPSSASPVSAGTALPVAPVPSDDERPLWPWVLGGVAVLLAVTGWLTRRRR